MKEPRVICDHCAGSGKRPLTYTEAVTLSAIGIARWSLTADVMARLKKAGFIVTNPALCNRLVELRRLGIVESRDINGRLKEWRRLP